MIFFVQLERWMGSRTYDSKAKEQLCNLRDGRNLGRLFQCDRTALTQTTSMEEETLPVHTRCSNVSFHFVCG